MTYVNEASVIVTSSLLMALGILSLTARFAIKRRKRASFGWDDPLAAIALIFTIGICLVCLVGAAKHRVGSHEILHYSNPAEGFTTTTPAQVEFDKFNYAFQILQALALGFIKLSILALYRRIFRGKLFSTLNWTLIAVTIGWTISITFAFSFPCGSESHYFWSSYAEVSKHCVNIFTLPVGSAIADVIVDIGILILPLPFVWQLHMPKSTKVAVSAVFLVGLLAVVAGILKMGFMLKINYFSHPGQIPPVLGLDSTDNIGIVSILLFWQMIQIGVAMITSCLLTLRPLMQTIWSEASLYNLRRLMSFTSWQKSAGSKSSMPDTNKMRRYPASGSSGDALKGNSLDHSTENDATSEDVERGDLEDGRKVDAGGPIRIGVTREIITSADAV